MADSTAQQADFFRDSEVPGGDRLAGWQPARWPVAADWRPLVARFFDSAPARRLGAFIDDRLAAGAAVYPPQPLRALELTPLAEVRVVILGQDPYHGLGQAEGLAFSVAAGVKLPPSLRNIFKELARERAAANPSAAAALPASGSLVRWAQQGVLLLNTCLTVEDGEPASHANKGWEVLTDEIFSAVLESGKPVAFLLWGAHAQRMAEVVRSRGKVAEEAGEPARHLILTANHPSPLSALRPPQPFLGCGHFGLANAFLQRHGRRPIDW
jgi:uracil-DNA glycosylase